MRRQRTIYFNDARHFYLFVFEPPMRMEDMWRPVDEVAGTGVDTLVYGVARADGLFYPSRAGKSFRSDMDEIDNAIYWKVRQNILSLEERGVDILQALADRAHTRGMEFFASFRMGTYEGVGSPAADPAEGGRGLADAGARENQLRVFEEMVTQYDLEGLELDFGASPGGMPPVLLDEDVAEYAPFLTEHVRSIAEMTRNAGKQVGMRVPCIEEVCVAQGFDVRAWLKEGLVDYVSPMMYANLRLDTQMPMEWAIEAAHEVDVPVYGMLQPFVEVGYPGHGYDEHYTPEMMRAAVSNYLAKGADGVYAWFLDWPLGATERNMLTEMANPDLMVEADKQYRCRAGRSRRQGWATTRRCLWTYRRRSRAKIRDSGIHRGRYRGEGGPYQECDAADAGRQHGDGGQDISLAQRGVARGRGRESGHGGLCAHTRLAAPHRALQRAVDRDRAVVGASEAGCQRCKGVAGRASGEIGRGRYD